ncbi:MAG: Phosphotransferase enzyme family protein [Syntrophorhabdaceae bacterium PtaU1.Bin034]|nr:MAG: Phosphotransferase enzyme family protein [Syntrophorhabdaceae bacterium PtaU1.Bin034]
MLLEMHCHTIEHSACSFVRAVDLVRQIYRNNVDGAIITDHHFLWSEEDLKSLKQAAEVPGFFVMLSGQEVTTSDHGDILVYGAEEAIARGISLAGIRTRYPHAALVFAHPYRNGKKPGRDRLLNPLLDAVEIFSSNHSVSGNARGLRDWHRYKFTAIAGTDTHALSYAGLYPTHFDHPIQRIEELADELKKGHCRPFFKEIPRAKAYVRIDEVTIGMTASDETREKVIIKEFKDGDRWASGERAFFIMKEIRRHGFAGGLYRVPKAIENDRNHMTLVEQGLRGNSLFERIIAADRDHARLFVRLSAQWLARLHNRKLRITPPEQFPEVEERHFAKYLDHFQRVGHRNTDRVREIVEEVRKAETALLVKHADKQVQVHGDYHPKNIYIGQDDPANPDTLFVAAIDFDNSYCLLPAFDVGTFLAQFRNQLIDHPRIIKEVPEEVFVDAYLSSARNVSPDFMSQIELFRARADLSILSFLVQIGLGSSENLWRVLIEAERALAQFQVGAATEAP